MSRPLLRLRLPRSLLEALDGYACGTGVTRAEAARDLLMRGLERFGRWPPRPREEVPPVAKAS